MHLIKDCPIIVTKDHFSAEQFIRKKVEMFPEDVEPFYAVDLEDVLNKHVRWVQKMPRVTPHYAVKCNDDEYVLKLLAFLGAGFDCASKMEIKTILDLGVSADRIIYANPCKQSSYVKYAAQVGVRTMTFDNEQELLKIKQICPHAKLVLRLVTDDSNAVCRFSMKFGADLKTARHLLEKAHEIELDVVGISFHCGSGQMTSKAFVDAIVNARTIMSYGNKLGFNMELLDIGGGFPGNADTDDYFAEIASAVNQALDEHFPRDSNVRIIAEPGRYYVASAYTLATNIIATREMDDYDTGDKKHMYYVNDGVYGSFNCVLYDHYTPTPSLFAKDMQGDSYSSSIWGPTCDGLDCINKDVHLPRLDIGDWILWKNMGAYTISGAVQFNGIPFGKPLYFMTKHFWDTVKSCYQYRSPTEKTQFESRLLRLNSGEFCSTEVEDDMIPWEDLVSDSSLLTTQ